MTVRENAVQAVVGGACRQHSIAELNEPRNRRPHPGAFTTRNPFTILPFSQTIVAGDPKPVVAARADAQNVIIGGGFAEFQGAKPASAQFGYTAVARYPKMATRRTRHVHQFRGAAGRRRKHQTVL